MESVPAFTLAPRLFLGLQELYVRDIYAILSFYIIEVILAVERQVPAYWIQFTE